MWRLVFIAFVVAVPALSLQNDVHRRKTERVTKLKENVSSDVALEGPALNATTADGYDGGHLAFIAGSKEASATAAAQRLVSVGLGEFGSLDASRLSTRELTFCESVGSLILSVASVVTAVYWNRGVHICLVITAYISSLSLMSVLIKTVFTTYNFKYPQFVTATHFLCTSIAGFALLARRRFVMGSPIMVPNKDTLLLGVLPVAITNALSIGFANIGLMYCNAHFYEMMSCFSVLTTAAIGVLLGKHLDPRLYPPLLVLSVGILAVGLGEVHFSVIGAMFIVFAILMRALKVQVQSLLLGGSARITQLDPIELVAWSGLTCFVVMATWSLAGEGMAPFERFQKWDVAKAVLISAVAACILNTSALMVLKELGPVAQQCVGQLKGVAASALAVATLGEAISRKQLIGYSIVVVSVVSFNMLDKRFKREAEERAAQKAELKS